MVNEKAETDPNKILYDAQTKFWMKVTNMRAKQVNKLVEDKIPRWKILLLKKSKLFSKFFGLYVSIKILGLEKGDVIRESLTLFVRNKPVGSIDFSVQDKRKLIDKKIDEVCSKSVK